MQTRRFRFLAPFASTIDCRGRATSRPVSALFALGAAIALTSSALAACGSGEGAATATPGSGGSADGGGGANVSGAGGSAGSAGVGGGQSGAANGGAGGAVGAAGMGGAGVAGAAGSAGGVVDPNARVLTIDFSPMSAEFPPTVNKIGFNSFWNSTTNDGNLDQRTIERSARYRAPMISGLVEPKVPLHVDPSFTDLFEEWAGSVSAATLDAQGCALWDQGTNYSGTLFHKNGGAVEARNPTDPDLASIRAFADAHGMVNFLQIAGTPGNDLPFSTDMDNGLFTLVGKPPAGGNWYPLPAQSDYPALAQAFGTLPDALGYDTRTIYAFWQEPSHTVDSSDTAEQSIAKYSDFYWRTARRIHDACRWESCPMAGAQLNSNDGDFSPSDERYQLFVDAVRQERASNPGVAIPLDYMTIQNYSAQWNDNIIGNSRLALGTDFDWTPVLMNEWDYCVNSHAPDDCPDNFHFFDRYDGPGSWRALHWLANSIEAPDVSHVLLREKVLESRTKAADETAGYTYPWTQVPILFMGSMSELRRPVANALPNVPVMASGDADQITIVMWNETQETKPFTLELQDVPSTLVGKTLSVEAISNAIREARCPGQDVMNANHEITCWKDLVAPFPIAGQNVQVPSFDVKPGEAVMVFAGAPPAYGSELFSKYFVRSYQYVDRTGTTAPPKGMGHFDPQTGSLTVGVKGMGTGVARAVLRNVPDAMTFRTRLVRQGQLAPTAVAGVRVDYFDDAHDLVKSVFHRDDRFGSDAAGWGTLGWPIASETTVQTENLCGATCTGDEGTDVTLNLAADAPPGWGAARSVEVGVVLTGTGTDATYRVDFP